jgi:hypothetical protein
MESERRKSIEELESQKLELLEQIDQIFYLSQMDEFYRDLHEQLSNEVKKIQREQDIKVAYDHMREMMENVTPERRKDAKKEDLDKIDEFKKAIHNLITK